MLILPIMILRVSPRQSRLGHGSLASAADALLSTAADAAMAAELKAVTVAGAVRHIEGNSHC